MPKRKLKGTVISNKMQKTIVVAIDVFKRHPIYDKILKRTKKFKAHNELEVKEGDTVVIEECRPLSKEVSWKVVEVLGEDKK